MRLSDFDYELPAQSIAQKPLPNRDAARMLLLDRASGAFDDRYFSALPELLRGDELLVVNNARVIPARLFAHRLGIRAKPPGEHSVVRREFLRSRIEVLLVRRIDMDLWEALVRPGRKVQIGERLIFDGASGGGAGDGRASGDEAAGELQPGGSELQAEVVGRGPLGLRQLRFQGVGDVAGVIGRIGHVPLPPYIRRGDELADRERYQTVFAKAGMAAAAPTAGLHFTESILQRMRSRGVEIAEITLEVGLGTFQPVHTENLEDHEIHSESYEIPQETAQAIATARRAGRQILAIGTTVVRALEDSARKTATATGVPDMVAPGRAVADIFILPGHQFAVVDQLLTNFHLPQSTLLALVSAFAGHAAVLSAYRHAVTSGYRFYSYGDCMLIR